MKPFLLSPLDNEDRNAYAEMLKCAFDAWYWRRGWGRDYFPCSPSEAGIFYDIYNDLTPGCSVAVRHPETKQIMGACFYHPREQHVSLGIMAVHPNYFGQGVGRTLVNEIVDFTNRNKYPSLRLVSSAMNIDSFSLYNRAGLVPRVLYHDMILAVPQGGLGQLLEGESRVCDAAIGDIDAMADLEMDVAGINRRLDYQYAIANTRGYLHASVLENKSGAIDGFAISVKSPALNMIGPCVARSEEDALALVRRAMEHFAGQVPLSDILHMNPDFCQQGSHFCRP